MKLSDLGSGEAYSTSFGIVDGSPVAYCDIENAEMWVAEVINKREEKVRFYPLDGRIRLFNSEGEQAECCDCMLADPELSRLIFIELKDRKLKPLDWLRKACCQLQSTIEGFREDLNGRDVCAQVCNKKHDRVVRCTERMESFKRQTGFRLYVGRQVIW